MLISLKFKNYKSFKNENILDLSSFDSNDKSKQYISHLAGIFGANAAGKTNLVSLFQLMKNYIIESYNNATDDDDYLYELNFEQDPYSFSFESVNQSSNFEIEFIDNKKNNYKYGFSLSKNENEITIITKEFLMIKPKNKDLFETVFIYNKVGNKEINKKYIKYDLFEDLNFDEQLHLLVSNYEYECPIFKKVYNFFENIVIPNIEDISYNKTVNDIIDIIKNNKKKTLLKYISSFDNSIVDFEITNNFNIDILTKHKCDNMDSDISISLAKESSGTLKMIQLFPYFMDVLEKGGILVIDEINAKLHPLLVRNILSLFSNKKNNPKNAQLIFTTHEPWLLNNGSLLPDEIWFIEKENNISELYNLEEFKYDRTSDIDIEESYLLGQFGAIPKFGDFKFKKNEK